MTLQLVLRGDSEGHDFHGNQWTGGHGGGDKPEGKQLPLGTAGLATGWSPRTPFDPTFASAYRNGDTLVQFSTAAAAQVSTDVQHGIMAQLGALQERDPIDQLLRVNVLAASEMRSATAAGETFTNASGNSTIQLNAAALDSGLHGMGDNVYKTLTGVGLAEYVVTHEYGHALQAAGDADRAERGNDLKFERERISMMKEMDPPSSYGNIRLTNEFEAYAESYADYRLSDSPGPLATALAEHDGWGAR